jgi:hypothetical protein
MQIQARADGRRSLHPLCMLARALAWRTACSGHQQPPFERVSRQTLRRLRRSWYGLVAVAASVQLHATVATSS